MKTTDKYLAMYKCANTELVRDYVLSIARSHLSVDDFIELIELVREWINELRRHVHKWSL